MSLSAIGGQWQALVRPTPGRAGLTAQMVLVCVLITIVVVTYRLPNLAVTVYAAFFLYRAERSATILTAIVMPIFITIVLAIALLSTVLVVDHPFWRVWSMATVSFAVLFLGSASKLKPFAPTLALILGYVLDLIGGLPVGELATRGFLYAWLIAGIPAAACIVVALLVGAPPRRLLEAALAERLCRAAGLLRGEDASAAGALLRQGDAAMCALLKSAQREHALVGGADAALSRAIDSSLAILCFAVLTAKRPVDASDDLARLGIAAALAEMAAIVEAGSYPVGIDLPPMHGTTELLRREVIAFAGGAAVPQPPRTSGFLLPDAFTNPAHVRYALKTTAAAMTCYIVFQLLDWPGIHTCLITCYVVSLGSAAETIEKLTLRICGCLFGAVLGFAALIFVLPHVDGITALAAIIALGTLPAAWVASGGPRVAYAGLQIAFAFYLIVLQGPSPAFDLSTGRDRIVGVLFGNLVVYLLFTKVWPVSLSAQVDPAIARILRTLSDLAGAGREGARHRIGGVRNAVAAVRQQLSVARYEPGEILPSNGWFRDRELALAEIDTLQLSVLEHVIKGGESDTAAARTLETLAARIEGGAIPPSETGRIWSCAALDRLVSDTNNREHDHAVG